MAQSVEASATGLMYSAERLMFEHGIFLYCSSVLARAMEEDENSSTLKNREKV